MDLQETPVTVQDWSATMARQLQQSSQNATSTNSSSQFVVVEKSVMYILAVIAGLVTLLYVLCMYQYLRARFLRRFARPDQDLPLYHHRSSSSTVGRTTIGGQSSADEIDRVASLNEQQRRQVIEGILSKKIVSSEDLYVAQPVTVTKGQPAVEADCRVDTEDTNPVNVQIRGSATATIQSDANHQTPVSMAHIPAQDSQSGVAPSGDQTNQVGNFDSEAVEVSYECVPVPESTSAIAVECHVQAHVEERLRADATDDEGSAVAHPPRANQALAASSMEDDPEGALPSSRPSSHLPISSAYTYNDEADDDDDDPTGDNLCPICLAGYRVGDVLVSSKHCSHNFHKDCILQWLERNTNCPVCRVEMVTHTEMNQAATVLVGKTRMIRAVATADQRRPSVAASSHSAAAAVSRPRSTAVASGATPPRGVKGPSFGAAMILPPGSYV